MKKLLGIGIIAICCLSSTAHARYWDCEYTVKEVVFNCFLDSDPYCFTGNSNYLSDEIEADSRGGAERKIHNINFSFIKKGFFSNKKISVCSQSRLEDQDYDCKYGVLSASCSSQ